MAGHPCGTFENMTVPLHPRGVLVVFEGIDGAGKTTQATRLARELRGFDLEVVETKEPTNGPWGQKLRESAATGRLSASEELQLFIKDRREHVQQLVEPALQRGAVVIVDRYFLSTAAYQGARGMDPESILQANEAFAPLPDVLFLLEVTPAVGRERIAKRGDRANLFEDEAGLAAAAQIFAQVRRDYVRRLDGERAPERLAADILIATYEGYVVDRMVSGPRPPLPDAARVVQIAQEVDADDTIAVADKADVVRQRVRGELL